MTGNNQNQTGKKKIFHNKIVFNFPATAKQLCKENFKNTRGSEF